MNCKSIKELIGPYIYGDLTPEEMNAIRTHAQHCKQCGDDIRSQMTLVAALPNAAPELTDEDRQRIAWTVKGAVKAAEPERRLKWFGLSPAYVMAAAVVIGMIGVKIVSSMSPDPAVAQKARVVVTEVQPAKPVNKDKVVDPLKARPDTPAQNVVQAPEETKPEGSREGSRPQIMDGIVGLRDRLPIGTFSNRHRKPDKPVVVPPEPPAPVVDPSETPDVRVETGDDKLPAPADVNDAQTTPQDDTDMDGTDSSESEATPR